MPMVPEKGGIQMSEPIEIRKRLQYKGDLYIAMRMTQYGLMEYKGFGNKDNRGLLVDPGDRDANRAVKWHFVYDRRPREDGKE